MVIRVSNFEEELFLTSLRFRCAPFGADLAMCFSLSTSKVSRILNRYYEFFSIYSRALTTTLQNTAKSLVEIAASRVCTFMSDVKSSRSTENAMTHREFSIQNILLKGVSYFEYITISQRCKSVKLPEKKY